MRKEDTEPVRLRAVFVWVALAVVGLGTFTAAVGAGAAAKVGKSSGDFAKAFVALTFSPIVGDDLWAANGLDIARSNDGGAHWTNITPPNLVGDDPGARIAGFASVGADDLWFAATEAGDVTPQHLRGFAVERSTDGGRTWRWTAVPTCSGCSMSLSFLTPRRGWTLGSNGNLYTTTDGGAHWLLRTKAPTFPSAMPANLDFTSRATGWLAASPSLYTSDDGGQRWRSVALPPASTGARAVTVGAAHFFGTQLGILPAVLSNGHTVTYETSDGGRHWTAQPSPVSLLVGAPGRWTVPVFSASSRDVWSIQSGYGPLADLFVTANGGHSWTRVLPPPTYAEAQPIWKLAMANATSGWILASAAPCPTGRARGNCGVAILLRTSDAGRHWQAIVRQPPA